MSERRGQPLLEIRQLTKIFGSMKVLDSANLQVNEGEIHALCGENGSGKSTIMNIICGMIPHGSYEGAVIYNGKLCKFKSLRDSEKSGIVVVHQEVALFPLLSIAENMFLGNEYQTHHRIDWEETYQKCADTLALVGVEEPPTTIVKDLRPGTMQFVEIAKALTKNVRLLILDEPMASLNYAESIKFLNTLLMLKNERGVTSIIISSKLNEIAYVADAITIIRNGRNVQTFIKGRDFIDESKILLASTGRRMQDRFPKRESNIGDICFEVQDWCLDHRDFEGIRICENVSFNVRHGEVLGLCALENTGRTAMAMSIFGKSYSGKCSGKLFINGKEVRLSNVKAAINAGIAYITENRKRNGLVMDESVASNISLPSIDRVTNKLGMVDIALENKIAWHIAKQTHAKCANVNDRIDHVSDGNQQKLLFGKWIFADPEVFILDEPTKGIDVVARYDIYSLINRLASKGKAIVLISSEISEILGMCDRIYIMGNGKIVDEMLVSEATHEKIMTKFMNISK